MTLARAPAAALALAALVSGCSTVTESAGRPVARAGIDEGMTFYLVGQLFLEAPTAWTASGDARRLRIDSPRGDARIEVVAASRPAASESECLADAEAMLARGTAGLSGVRRHPTTFAGRPAVTQEADQGAWHGWAYGVCDGPRQYRIWFSGLSPMGKDLIEAHALLVSRARFEAGP
jgi:hypothetical protein